MGFELDQIVLIDLDVSETISNDYSSEVLETDRIEGGFAVTAYLDNGIGSVNMTFSIELSTDGVNFAEIPDTDSVFQDTDGTIIWDILQTSTQYVRVKVVVASGTIDLTKITLRGKRRH